MGKGQIISQHGAGRYSVKILNDRTKADKALSDIDKWIALNQARQDRLIVGDPYFEAHKQGEDIAAKLRELKLAMASLLKQKEYLLKIPPDPTVSAWCADYTEDLTGTVGTIEINGDPGAGVNLRPGYPEGNAAHNPGRDGQTMNIRSMTPEQAFYNLAMMPGWQKWRPTYRLGTIMNMTGITCSVRLDDAYSSMASNGTGPLNINEVWDIANVPIQYMTCNESAFKIGDRVLVQFMGQVPKVIGFVSNPKKCAEVFFFQPYAEGSNVFLGVYNILGQVVGVYDLNALFGNSPDKPMWICNADSDSNSVFVIVWETNGWYSYRIPIFWFWEQQSIHKVMGSVNFANPTLNSLSAGGLRLHGLFDASNLFNTILVTKVEQQIGMDMLQVKAALWTDTTNIGFIDPGEVYPSDYQEFWVEVKGMAWDNDTPQLIMGLWIGRDSVHPHSHVQEDAYIETCHIAAYWASAETGLRYFTADPNWINSNFDRVILTIPTVAEFQRIDQLFCYDGRLFIFRKQPVELSLYDLNGNFLVSAICAPSGNDWTSATASIVIVDNMNFLCVQWVTVTCDPNIKTSVYLLDIDTLEIMRTVSFPGACLPKYGSPISYPIRPTFAAVNKPMRPSFLIAVNAYRVSQGSLPISYSVVAASVAQEHAEWCVANGRLSHIGLDDEDVHVRLFNRGIFFAAENLALAFMAELSVEFSQVIEGWAASPGHKANLIYADDIAMGFGVATYPPECHTIIVGPGKYIPETGGYTTVDTEWVVPPEYYGKVRAYVYNAYVF